MEDKQGSTPFLKEIGLPKTGRRVEKKVSDSIE